jgi:hypothetical protein
MKKCSYCGRENTDEAVHCAGCGTAFPTPPAAAPTRTPRDWTWLEWLGWCLRYVAVVLVIGLIYLLSLGPVERYIYKATSRTSTTTTSGVNGQTVVTRVVRISYPRWVGIVYRPAFLVRSSSGGNGLYGRYLEWWTAGRRKQ